MESQQEFTKERENAAKNFFLNKSLEGLTVQDLERRLASLSPLESSATGLFNATGSQADKSRLDDYKRQREIIQQQILEVEAFDRQKAERDRDAFEQNWENYKRLQEAERHAEKARLENIEEAKKKVEELGKTYLAAFAGIGVGNENPFVRLYNEGEAALKSFREQTQGLSRDLVMQGEMLIKQQTDLARFRARADAAFEGLDLRQQARNFRNPAQQAESQEQYLKRIEDGLNRAYNSGFFGLRRSPDEGQLQLTPEMARQAYATYLAGAGMNLPGLTDASRTTVGLAGIRNAEQRAAETRTASERLDEQLKLAEQLRRQADTEQKRAEIDARIVGLSRGIDPTQIRPDQREAIATALENMAVRTEKRETDAEAVNKDLLATNAQIRDYLETLKTAAEKGGTQKLDITLQDATGQVQRASSPTPDTVSITGF